MNMLYRRKFIGGLLQIFGGKLANIDLQKYLLLATDMQEKPLYEFTPYRYGCFSFTSYCDRRAMARDRLIKSLDERWEIDAKNDYLMMLNEEDRSILESIKNNFGKLTGDKLIKYVYDNYPYYTIKSEIANQFLSDEEIKKNKEKYSHKTKAVFSIGYEGKSVEAFLNELIQNNVKILIDVRKNPISMKYGFSRSQIQGFLKNFGISYIHIPQLGIESEKRKGLKTADDYNDLFAEYEKTTLSNAGLYLWQVKQLFDSYNRICLMCFEADPNMCHRTRILKQLVSKSSITGYKDL